MKIFFQLLQLFEIFGSKASLVFCFTLLFLFSIDGKKKKKSAIRPIVDVDARTFVRSKASLVFFTFFLPFLNTFFELFFSAFVNVRAPFFKGHLHARQKPPGVQSVAFA